MILRQILIIGLFALSSSAAAAESYWRSVAGDIAASVAVVVERARAGDAKTARQALTEAYFGHYEDRKMEAAVRKEIGGQRARDVEALFADMRKAVQRGDTAAVESIATQLNAALAADGKALDEAGVPAEVFAVNK